MSVEGIQGLRQQILANASAIFQAQDPERRLLDIVLFRKEAPDRLAHSKPSYQAVVTHEDRSVAKGDKKATQQEALESLLDKLAIKAVECEHTRALLDADV